MSERIRVSFFVPGIPRPGGSKRAMPHSKTGKIIVLPASKYTADWRAAVAAKACEVWGTRPLLRTACVVDFQFQFPRPKSHYRSGRDATTLKMTAPWEHTQRPDRGKLLRSTEDALTGVIWLDDCLIVGGKVEKCWGEPAGAYITIRSVNHGESEEK